MLISELENEALSTMISNSHGDYSGVHQLLCECAETMINKYNAQEATAVNRDILEIKTKAATILLQELKRSRSTPDALSHALERHVEVLQGHQHLLSERGNNYALIKQTQQLMEQYTASASFLHYYTLKNKLLGPDSPLDDKQKEFLSELDGRKCLRLETLRMADKDPASLSPVTMEFFRNTKKMLASGELELPNTPDIVRLKRQIQEERQIQEAHNPDIDEVVTRESSETLS